MYNKESQKSPMKHYTFENIYYQIRNGMKPPTAGYHISQQQFFRIEKAIQENMDEASSEIEKKNWSEYLETWRIKILIETE